MSEQKRDKRYNLQGMIQSLRTGKMKNGGTWAAFKVAREGKKATSVVAFDNVERADDDKAMKASNLLKSFGEGDVVRLYGFYQDDSFTAEDGKKVSFSRLNVLWSGEPKVAEEGAAA